MKKIFLLITFLTLNLTFAQKECEYSSNVTDSLGIYKSTKEYLVQERIFGGSKNGPTMSYKVPILPDGS